MTASGCAHSPERAWALEAHPECRDRDRPLRERLERTRTSVADGLESAAVDVEGDHGVDRGLAVRSYPEHEGALRHNSYLYDNALALLWYEWAGESDRARRIAAHLLSRQRADGSWRSVFVLRENDETSGRVYSGAVAWAGYALAYIGHRRDWSAARSAARRSADFLWERRQTGEAGPALGGLIAAGYRFDQEGRRADRFAATEHQFDAHALLAQIAPERADELERRILKELWIEEEGRFGMGLRVDGPDPRRALDASGAWGAMWLQSVGRDRQARRSLDFALDSFASTETELQGFRPYLDRTGDYLPDQHPEHIFVEGSMSVGLAALRLGRDPVAERSLRLGARLQCMTENGLPYSNLETAQFSTEPAAAPSIWFLFLEREWRSGRPAPVFRTFHDSERERRTRP